MSLVTALLILVFPFLPKPDAGPDNRPARARADAALQSLRKRLR